jgi:sigma-B regulation protein RsbU (phosphoserine phosphatase)
LLDSLVEAQRSHLEGLAGSWLAAGARAFAIWSNGRPLVHWPAGSDCSRPTLTANIQLDALTVGEVRITGPSGAEAQSRLAAEASLLSQMVRLKRDLNIMTAELIDTQDQLLALYDLSQATRNYLDVEGLLRRLAYEAARLIKVEGAFMLLQASTWPLLVEHYPGPLLDDATLRHYLDEARSAGHEFLYSGQGGLMLNGVPFRNLLLVPIQIRGEMIAALGLVNKPAGDFNSPDIKLARAIGEHAGAQIENLLLYQEHLEQTRLQTEMRLAQNVQLNLLPQRPPGVPGLELWAGSRPASRVGGDFYDFIARPDGEFIFTVGDVSGKGMPAALLMAMTRTVLRNKANASPPPTPEVVMDRSNAELYHDFNEVSMFATVFVGQYDPGSRNLVYANAGHSPVVFCRAGGEAELLRADGTAMGVLPQSFAIDRRMNLGPGDLLIVGTDGLNEAHNGRDEMFGYDRFLSLIQSLAGQPAAVIAENLYQSVNAFSNGQPQDDDQTLLVVKGVAS